MRITTTKEPLLGNKPEPSAEGFMWSKLVAQIFWVPRYFYLIAAIVSIFACWKNGMMWWLSISAIIAGIYLIGCLSDLYEKYQDIIDRWDDC